MTGIYIPNPDAGMYSVIPTSFISRMAVMSTPTSVRIAPTPMLRCV